MSQQRKWWLTPNEHPARHRPPLTITSIRSASLTCASAVFLLTHGSPGVAPEQSRACESRLACRQSAHSQTVNPMIQAGTRLFPAPVSSLLYTLGSANGEQMQGEREAMPASHRQTAHHRTVCYAPSSGLRSCRNMSNMLRGPPPYRYPPPTHPNLGRVSRIFSTYVCN